MRETTLFRANTLKPYKKYIYAFNRNQSSLCSLPLPTGYRDTDRPLGDAEQLGPLAECAVCLVSLLGCSVPSFVPPLLQMFPRSGLDQCLSVPTPSHVRPLLPAVHRRGRRIGFYDNFSRRNTSCFPDVLLCEISNPAVVSWQGVRSCVSSPRSSEILSSQTSCEIRKRVRNRRVYFLISFEVFFEFFEWTVDASYFLSGIGLKFMLPAATKHSPWVYKRVSWVFGASHHGLW